LAVVTAALALAVGTAHAGRRGITVKGSDTMVILGQRWAETYMGSNPKAIVQVTGGGSGTGIAALINGTTDICMASRPMKEDEKLKLRDRYQTRGVELPVARDGLSIYLHESNAVKELTIAQIRDVYTGKTTNWSQLGGAAGPIVVYGRENSSGTYVYFKDNVLLGQDFSPRCQTLPGTSAVVNAVAQDPKGIGYGGAAYAKGIKDCAVKKDDKSPGIMPTLVTVRDGSYPITRFLYLYTRNRPSGDVKKFVDWIVSDAGQAVVSKVGYFPIR
jgi:phosphate transport system substrate-binding protein